ncbi:MAG: hypothetical protein ACR5LF_00670 [Symbiopectobacterium sp.]
MIKGEAPNLTVDVLPLVARLDQNNQMIQNSVVYNRPVYRAQPVVYNRPVYRAQRGNSAIIMNPVPEDIGWIAVCDRDNSVACANRKESVPGSCLAHSKSDAIYIGRHTQYVGDGRHTQYAADAVYRVCQWSTEYQPNPVI